VLSEEKKKLIKRIQFFTKIDPKRSNKELDPSFLHQRISIAA
jgi:hypothetical protein